MRPALQLSETYEAFYFIADYHALNAITNPKALKQMTYEVAAAWLSMGLNPNKVTFYRQSDVPETFQLFSVLANSTAKGLMNRAHAYKASVDRNMEQDRNPDDGINMGLFNYPILMAADILIFSADVVPIGHDQLQHLEITRDIVETFNKTYGNVLTLPKPVISQETSVPGLDGRKMSKSYDNTIPLLTMSGKKLQKLVRKFKTDSSAADAPKDADNSSVFKLYKELAIPEDAASIRLELMEGKLSWGGMKDLLYETLEKLLEQPRAKYEHLMANPKEIEQILQEGAHKAKPEAQALVSAVRNAIGVNWAP